IQGSLMDVGM
nr:Chain D, S-phase delaying protein 1 [Schizosaccharomyces pombe]